MEQNITPVSSLTRSAHSHNNSTLYYYNTNSFSPSHYHYMEFSFTSYCGGSCLGILQAGTAIAEATVLVSFKQGLSTIKYWTCSRRQPYVVPKHSDSYSYASGVTLCVSYK